MVYSTPGQHCLATRIASRQQQQAAQPRVCGEDVYAVLAYHVTMGLKQLLDSCLSTADGL